jgi:hypothetical protein
VTDDSTTMAGGITNWDALDVPALWTMVAGEDDESHWRHVRAWWTTENMLLGYRKRLEACRDALMAKWPPERSEAAGAFVRRVNEMIISVNQTLDTASKNAGGLIGVSSALMAAKRELKPIYDQWRQNEDIEGTTYLVDSDTVPVQSVIPDLGDNWRGKLNEAARKVVSDSEQALFESARRMEPPPSFRPIIDPPVPDDGGNAPATHASGGGLRPPVIPPPTLQGPPGAGPILTGGSNPLVPQPPYPGVPVPPNGPPTPGGPGPGGGPWFVPTPPTGPGLPPGRVLEPGGPPGRILEPGGPASRGRLPGPAGEFGTQGRFPGTTAGERMPLAPGGVIGPQGGARTTAGGRPTGGAGRRVNPVGGVIGSGASGVTPSGHTFQIRDPAESRRRGRRERDPNDPWAVDEGVPPVIEPGPEPRHDPGPGVIGIDR